MSLFSHKFSPPDQTDFSKTLHLGTLRLYQPDGSFNQANWDAFAQGKPSISAQALAEYLEQKNQSNPEEPDTGRNTNSFFSSKHMQIIAGREAWKEAFKILACDWQREGNALVPYVDATLLELFFKDTLTCLELASRLELPVPKHSAATVDIESTASQIP